MRRPIDPMPQARFEDVVLAAEEEDRAFAEVLTWHLERLGRRVYLDIAYGSWRLQDVTRYVGPLHETAIRPIVVILSERYGGWLWDLLEEGMGLRIEDGDVLPLWSTAVPPDVRARLARLDSLSFDPYEDLAREAERCAFAVDKWLGWRPYP